MMINYLGLWFEFAKNSLIRQLEYKANMLGRFLTETIWLAGQLLFFKAIFLQVPQFAGWTEAEIYFFVGSLYLVDGSFMLLLSENQNRFGDLVRNGLFDFYLLRPRSAFFMACFRHLNIAGFVNLSGGILLSVWALTRGGISLTGPQIAVWLLYLAVGFGLLVCLLMGICCLAFWITQTANLNWLFFELYRLGWRPENLYPLWMRRFLWAIFPAAFLISVPVQLTLGKLSGAWYVYPWIWLAVVAFALRIVWNKGVARYEGALS
ncbi:MAG: ABC-2 family transporter protein [Bdellovibrionota bacterium]